MQLQRCARVGVRRKHLSDSKPDRLHSTMVTWTSAHSSLTRSASDGHRIPAPRITILLNQRSLISGTETSVLTDGASSATRTLFTIPSQSMTHHNVLR